MLTSDVFIENPFVNSAVIGLSNGLIVDLRHKKQHSLTQCNKKARLALFVNKAVGLKMHFLASKPLIIMQIPHNFN